MWEFLIGLKETTVSGFARMEAQFDSLRSELRSEMERMEQRLNTRIAKVDDRLSEFQKTISERLPN
jgi:hypothetical protein